MKIDPYFSCCRKYIFKWIKDLNIKPGTSNIIEEKLEKNNKFCGIR